VIQGHLAATSNTGTPHWWLRTHGIPDDYETAVLLDSDGDAQPTWQEYISDTDPLAGTSRLELVAAPDGLRFETHLDRDYTVMESPDLTADRWTVVPAHPVAGTGEPVILPYPPGIPRRFYRLHASLTTTPSP
jgi:hypothetical protein